MQRIVPRPFALLLLITLIISLTSFAGDDPTGKNTSNDNDSTKGFKNLLSSVNKNSTNKNGLTSCHFELDPRAVPFVNDFLPRVASDYENMKTWGKPYFILYD